ncbi:MAG: DUF2207 domain-containing protein [Acidobacteriota bacterium]
MIWRRALLPMVLWAALTASCARPAVVVPVDRFETTVTLLPDGSLDVQEQITVTAAAAGSVIRREIAPPEADSVVLQSTRLDGPYQGGTREGITAENRGRRLTILWRVPSDGSPRHELSIRYRAFAAVRVDEPRAYLTWIALLPGRGFDVGTGALTLVLPSGMPFYEGTGIAEAGWTVERHAAGISATRQNISNAESATILGDVDLRSTMAEGQWQIDEDRQWNLLPAYASGGLFMLVIGAGTQWILRAQHPRRRTTPVPDPERLYVANGLRTTAWVGTLVAIGCSLFAYFFLPRLGHWIQLIPAGMIAVAVMFVVLARRWEREGLGRT